MNVLINSMHITSPWQVWQTAAQEKEGEQGQLNDRIAEMERQAQEQRQQLQEKVRINWNKHT